MKKSQYGQNNKMELIASINALQKISKGETVEIYTDSKYVKLGITDFDNT